MTDPREDPDNIFDDIGRIRGSGGRRWRGFWTEVGLLARLGRAVAKGEYMLATPQIAALLATLGYVAFPVDAVPDAVPVAGWADDAGVVALTVGALSFELAMFREWEIDNGRA